MLFQYLDDAFISPRADDENQPQFPPLRVLFHESGAGPKISFSACLRLQSKKGRNLTFCTPVAFSSSIISEARKALIVPSNTWP